MPAEVGAAMGVAEAPYSDADLSKPEAVRGMVGAAQAALGTALPVRGEKWSPGVMRWT